MDPSSIMMPTTMRILDFYRMKGNKIQYNWMMIDTVDLMRQAGRQDAKVAKEIVKKALYFDFAAETNDSSCHSSWIEDMTW